MISLDFEGASRVNLKEVGAYVWTSHKHTLPICASFALNDGEVMSFELDPRPWISAEEALLLNLVNEGEEIHAWNAGFEFSFWNNICVPRFHWPRLPIDRFHCTMATASLAGLPRKLEHAGPAAGAAHVKDMAGHRQMLMMARPRSIDANGGVHWWHREDPAKLKRLIEYNVNDVLSERCIGSMIPRMSQREREIWLCDQRMNQRGLPIDKKLLVALDAITMQETFHINNEIARITAGAVASHAQVAQLLAWVQMRGYPHDTLKRETLEGFVNSPKLTLIDDAGQQVLKLRLEAAKSSTKKLVKIGAFSPDGVVRNLIQYGGAPRTMRWSGEGPQIQNLPRPAIRAENIKAAIDEILDDADADTLRLLYGRPLDVVSSCIRGVFKAPPGSMFAVCDYSSIEAIVLAWLAEFDELLDVFRRGEDVYVYTAAAIGSTNRQLGKTMRLALGFSMGAAKFQDKAASDGIALTISEATRNVNAFRAANKPICDLWYGCEAIAKKAIGNPGAEYAFKRIKFRMANPKRKLARALLMTLPSGRHLVYRDVRIDSNGEIRFWGVDQYRKVWCELKTYGGSLVENATQATARDLLAEAIVAIDRAHPDTLLTTVHDEVIGMDNSIQVHKLLHTMKSIMSIPPVWAIGLPVSCKGAIIERYCKL